MKKIAFYLVRRVSRIVASRIVTENDAYVALTPKQDRWNERLLNVWAFLHNLESKLRA